MGRPPTIRLDGRLRALETKVLEPDDTDIDAAVCAMSAGEASQIAKACVEGALGVVVLGLLSQQLLLAAGVDQVPTLANLAVCRAAGCRMVIGTTGFDADVTISRIAMHLASADRTTIVSSG